MEERFFRQGISIQLRYMVQFYADNIYFQELDVVIVIMISQTQATKLLITTQTY